MICVQPPKAHAAFAIDDAAIAAILIAGTAMGVTWAANKSGVDMSTAVASAVADKAKAYTSPQGLLMGFLTGPVLDKFKSTGALVLSWDGWQAMHSFFQSLAADLAGSDIAITVHDGYFTYDGVPVFASSSLPSDGSVPSTLLSSGVFFNSITQAWSSDYLSDTFDLTIQYHSESWQPAYLAINGAAAFWYTNPDGYLYYTLQSSDGVNFYYNGAIYSSNGSTYTFRAADGTSSALYAAYQQYYVGGATPAPASDVVINGSDNATAYDRVYGLRSDTDNPVVYAPDLLPAWSSAGAISSPDVIDGVTAGTITSADVISGAVDTTTGAITDAATGTMVGTLTDAGVVTGATTAAAADIAVGDVTIPSSNVQSLGTLATQVFPFSIPWDFTRAIKLLAAPAEAPYFQVDLLAPLAGKVGGWQGSTTITLDMSDYEVLGGLCRWCSTIGFCLALILLTKRLIWTA